ncbi:glutathione S-transferase family protein [Devosia sp. LjRoot16]|uniref:glutathione S-transferase family protein n=1 Tax=Devosia sp. LjRoot16 TaxID=3342271 RepID=UPI003ECC5CE7
MTITLWGRLSSGNVQKVVWALEELELPCEHVPLGGGFKGNDTPEYLAMNPNGLVPTLRDGNLTIWESHAIVRYLSAEYGSGLLFPMEARDRAVVDQWTDWTATTFQPAWIGLFWLKVRTPVAQQDATAIDKALAASIKCFRLLEARLAEAPYLGGNELSYADIVAGASLFRWSTMPIERPSLPHVEAWHSRLNERAAFRKAINVSYEELVGRLAF